MTRWAYIFTWVVFILAGCGLQTGAPPVTSVSPASPASPAPTAGPTWTLHFEATLSFTSTSPAPHPTHPPNVHVGLPVLMPTPTPSPVSPSPTARPRIDPTLGVRAPDPSVTPEIPIPGPASPRHMDKDVVNILLLGRDTASDAHLYRTDAIIVASLNKHTNSVLLLTIPRDLYVYIPGWTMGRINTAAEVGDASGYPGGGVALLEQTILYNLGIPIHGWVRIDFAGFQNVVDTLGGVDVPVSCSMTDWRLKDEALSLDDQNPADWQLYTVATGVQHMDGSLALWYARSREHSSDFDRSRRQHQVLRAIFDKALKLGALPKLPQLYAQYAQTVDTNLGLGDLLQFVPMAARLPATHIKSRFIGPNQVSGYMTSDGSEVLLPNQEAVAALLDEALGPPAQDTLPQAAPGVEIWNGTPNQDWPALAADNLKWAGIQPVMGQADATTYPTTTLYDFTGSPKGSLRPQLQLLFHVLDANVVSAPNPAAAYPYRVILGSDFNSCAAPVK